MRHAANLILSAPTMSLPKSGEIAAAAAVASAIYQKDVSTPSVADVPVPPPGPLQGQRQPTSGVGAAVTAALDVEAGAAATPMENE